MAGWLCSEISTNRAMEAFCNAPRRFLAALPSDFWQRFPPFKPYPLSLPISPAGQHWRPAFFASLSEPSQKKLPAPARFGRRVYMSASGQDFHGGTLSGNCRHRALLYQFFFSSLTAKGWYMLSGRISKGVTARRTWNREIST